MGFINISRTKLLSVCQMSDGMNSSLCGKFARPTFLPNLLILCALCTYWVFIGGFANIVTTATMDTDTAIANRVVWQFDNGLAHKVTPNENFFQQRTFTFFDYDVVYVRPTSVNYIFYDNFHAKDFVIFQLSLTVQQTGFGTLRANEKNVCIPSSLTTWTKRHFVSFRFFFA